MSDFHPRVVIDQVLPDRTGEVGVLREELAATLAEATTLAGRVVDAEEAAEHHKRCFAALLVDWARVVAERDRARDLAQRCAEQPIIWHEGPS